MQRLHAYHLIAMRGDYSCMPRQEKQARHVVTLVVRIDLKAACNHLLNCSNTHNGSGPAADLHGPCSAGCWGLGCECHAETVLHQIWLCEVRWGNRGTRCGVSLCSDKSTSAQV
jgi:hypothetical protein